jgi:hypothetical protein
MSYTITTTSEPTNKGWTGIKVKGTKSNAYTTHEVWDGAPCDWSRVRGATHTLDCGIGPGRGTRPAKLLKSVIYVGIDEADDMIVWEKWSITIKGRNGEAVPGRGWSGFFNNQ